MNSKKHVAIVIHNHQPIGNFDFVMEDNYRLAYLPFIEILSKFPKIKCHFHFSGPLIDFLKKEHPDIFTLLKKLIVRGQVKMISGAYYEPVLAAIPEEHRKLQIKKMNDFLSEELGVTPEGIWLAERIWEDSVIPAISDCGIKYTLLDEEHFEVAEIPNPDGAYLTESGGKNLMLFPIDKRLRYDIPAKSVEDVMKYIGDKKQSKDLYIIADDGEKFGAWPGSNERVYKNKWLSDFFELLIKDGIETIFLDEYIKNGKVNGPVYFPPLGYEAMNVWSLDTELQFKHEYWKELLENKEIIKNLKRGYFKNFFVKYTESGWMHKRGIFASELFRSSSSIEHILASECNCVYWHGMFGGIYLPHLRDAIYKELIIAQKESELEYPVLMNKDIDLDGEDEIFYSDGYQNMFFHKTGGTLLEWDLLDDEINLLNTMSRRPELYHKEAYETIGEKNLNYDIYRRNSFIDRCISSDCTIAQFFSGKFGEQSTFYKELYGMKKVDENTIISTCTSYVITEDGLNRIEIEKEYKILENGLDVMIDISNKSDKNMEFWYGNEINFSFVSPFKEFLVKEDCDGTTFSGRDINIKLNCDSGLSLWGAPIETVSRNHHEFEKIFQCGCYLLHKKLFIDSKGTENMKFSLRVKE